MKSGKKTQKYKQGSLSPEPIVKLLVAGAAVDDVGGQRPVAGGDAPVVGDNLVDRVLFFWFVFLVFLLVSLV